MIAAMASAKAGSTGWFRGRVKAVTSGDCLVIMAMTNSNTGIPPEKTITLSSLIAPRLVISPAQTPPLSLTNVLLTLSFHDAAFLYHNPLR